MTVDDYAQIVLSYMKLNMPLKKRDAILGLGGLTILASSRYVMIGLYTSQESNICVII